MTGRATVVPATVRIAGAARGLRDRPGPQPASASIAIAPLLRGTTRPLVVVAVFARATYLAVGEELVALVTADGVRHPNAMVLTTASSARPLAGLHVGQRGAIGDGRLRIGHLEVRACRWWDPRPRLRPCSRESLAAASELTHARMVGVAGEPSEALTGRLAEVAAAVGRGDLGAASASARGLIGLGPGLTPAGDDLLAGFVSGTLVLAPSLLPRWRAPGPPTDAGRVPGSPRDAGGAPMAPAETVRRLGDVVATAASGRTTSVSEALLRHAARGRLAGPAIELLRAWTASPEVRRRIAGPEAQGPARPGASERETLSHREQIVRATDGLLAVGSTSGRDLTVGLLAAAGLLTAHPGYAADRGAADQGVAGPDRSPRRAERIS